MSSFSTEDFLDFSEAACLIDPYSEIGGLTYQKNLVDSDLTEIAESGFRAAIYADADKNTIVITFRRTVPTRLQLGGEVDAVEKGHR